MTAALEQTKKDFSLEEFFAWINKYGKDDAQYELINGKITEKDADILAGPDRRRGKVISWLSHYLLAFTAGQTAEVFSDTPCTLGVKVEALELEAVEEAGNISSISLGKRKKSQAKRTKADYVKPDVALFLAGRLLPDVGGPIAEIPDIVAEVNSPSDTTERIFDKVTAYQKAGVPIIWSIYLLEKYVRVYHKQANDGYQAYCLELQNELEGAEMLPGFKLVVSKLFE